MHDSRGGSTNDDVNCRKNGDSRQPPPASDSPKTELASQPPRRRTLFLVSFLILFLELACIRWFAAHVVFLQFFTNIVLIACFLGMSVGCLCAKVSTDWLRRFPYLVAISVAAAVVTNHLYVHWAGLAVDVGQHASPQVVYFGTESRDVDLAKLVMPMELSAGFFFVLLTLTFVGLGQALGRELEASTNRVAAYTINIAGSVSGVAVFSLSSFAGLPPLVWFLVAFAGVSFLLTRTGRPVRAQLATLAATLLLIGLWRDGAGTSSEVHWSPYYLVRYAPAARHIMVNTISHQDMVAIDEGAAIYSLVHLLERDSGGAPFEDALVIGAGSGNDVAHAIASGVLRVDAVEIDPAIYQLGKKHHPDRPYDSSRVRIHLDDGRHYLRRTDRKYDLVTYALVDSLILHSSYSNVRLESFLFTEEAFRDVERALKPGGVFVMYNYFRQGWIIERLALMLETVFGKEPLVLSVPYLSEIAPGDNLREHMTVLIAGDTERIAEAFRGHGSFWLYRTAAMNRQFNGFRIPAEIESSLDSVGRLKIAPARLVRGPDAISAASDDWPFLYLRSPLIPALCLRGMALMSVLALIVLFALAPGHRVGFDGRMFFLGAAFLLLETKAVVHLALLFGSTWLVNSVVFFAILMMILASNLYVLKVSRVRLWLHYAALFVSLTVNSVVPLDVFLSGNLAWRYSASCLLVFLPIFFAGVIFAESFRGSVRPDRDFGSNIAGAVLGGLAEYSSLVLGFRHVLLVAMLLYAVSAAFRRGSAAASG